VCYTDVQGINDHYGIATFPFVPGHEIVGTTTAVGSEVTEIRAGDRVGIGWQGRSCGHCEYCLRGDPQLCVEIDNCGVWKPYGGFSTAVNVDSRFAYPLPASMPSETAAVLMCAGISVFTPLWTYAAQGGKKVGVIGVGGLGHLAIQFARALGCEVTAISSTPGKQQEALKFGADHFLLVNDREAMHKVHFTFDLVLYISHAKGDWTGPLNLVKTRGKFVVVGFPDEKVVFDPMEVIVHEMAVIGSFIGNPMMMKRMLTFAQEKHIQPMIELLPMSKANEAVERIQANKARYRIVLVN
jgi:uncharacterized zinc-type alcohol dehydrogenase-like protein